MRIELELFGALRGVEPHDRLVLEVDGACVADLRRAVATHAAANWPGIAPGLLQRCAFATPTQVLRDAEPLPPDGRMAILPPVSGG
ncbi:MoaD/ThiS family protein [Arenimonas sp.]|uniref:MoaD/ThiS family protein n=1 Tax=Arenimonas sp. TaxID=1872635 RepID=UPI0039E2B244